MDTTDLMHRRKKCPKGHRRYHPSKGKSYCRATRGGKWKKKLR